MIKFDFKKYNRGTIKLEIQSLIPEKFINLLWKNNVYIKNITKISITTMIMEINLKDYRTIESIAKKTNTKIRIVGRSGISFFFLRMKRNTTLAGGILIFLAALYYLSTFIWRIDITTEKYISPYEIRRVLLSYGIKPGVPKKNLNVYALEEKVIGENEDIMWFKARIEGSKLIVSLAERITPPVITLPEANEPCNVVSKSDAEIVSIYTTAGTAVVKKGDMVKSGQLLIKGEQGKDGSTYSVHAKGKVIAKTFYEETRELPLKGVKEERTGKKIENIFINILGKKIYVKKNLNNFPQYDKIDDNNSFFKKEMFYEVINKEFQLDREKVINDAVEEMSKKTLDKLDKSVKLVDKIVTTDDIGNNVRINAVFIIEQDIALEQKLQ